MRTLFAFLFLLFHSIVVLSAQEEIVPTPEELSPSGGVGAEESPQERLVRSLRSQLQAIQIVKGDVDELKAQMDVEMNEVSKEEVRKRLDAKAKELRKLVIDFQETAAGVDIGLFEDKPKEEFSWEKQLGEILRPILAEMEAATSLSRKIADLRQEEERFEEREKVAGTAADQLERLSKVAPEGGIVQAALKEEMEVWREREQLARNRAEAASLQLENLVSQEKGLLEGSTTYIRKFMSERGLNLLIGIGSAFAVFFLVRIVLVVARRTRKTDNPRNFGSRVFVLTANLISVIGAVAAMLIAFSATGDLFLFGIVLLFLLGVAWGGMKVLPQFVESLKLILNIGMVKEGERIEYDGVPWNVESLGFKCRLVNSRLDGAVQPLPVKELVGHHSRPWCEGEKEFPCTRGEWVQLSDERLGKVIVQNPSQVVVEELGGARVTFTAADFLGLAPRNISESTFRVQTRFGVDYKHQEECTTAIPRAMEEAVRQGVVEMIGEECVKSVEVQFALAAASSLDYEIEVDLAGTCADRYESVLYGLQRILVDCCNKNGWEIPFQQITVGSR